MHIPPHLLPPAPAAERPTALTQPRNAHAASPTNTSLDALSQLPAKALEQALRNLPVIAPDALANKLAIKQPTLIEAVIAKQTTAPLTAQILQQTPSATRSALAQWQNTQAATSSNMALTLSTLIIAKRSSAQMPLPANAPPAAYQLVLITPQASPPGKVGEHLALLLGAKGELSLATSSAALANKFVPPTANAQLASKALPVAGTSNLTASQHAIKHFQTLTSSHSSAGASAEPSAVHAQRIAAIQHLSEQLSPSALPATVRPTGSMSESSALSRLANTLAAALALPGAQQLQALPKPLFAAIERALPELTANRHPSTLDQLIQALTPKAQMKQLPAIVSALSLLSKLVPGGPPARTYELSGQPPSATPQVTARADSAETIHRLLQQDLTQLAQSLSRSLLARSVGLMHEPLQLQQELSFHHDSSWLNGHIQIEEKPPDKGGRQSASREESKATWEVNLTLEVPMREQTPLAMEVRVVWQPLQTQVTFWSRQAATCERLNAHKPSLLATLNQAGIAVNDCTIIEGSAPTKAQAIRQQWTNIDIHT